MSTPARRIGIVAGRGRLPVELAERLQRDGMKPFIVRMAGEAGEALDAHDGTTLALERIAYAIPALKAAGVTDVILAGGVNRRPVLGAVRAPLSLLPQLPRFLGMLTRGDNDLLSFIVSVLESKGITVIGAHSVLPDHVMPNGALGRIKPNAQCAASAGKATEAALEIGRLDIGQAVVVQGRRIIAVEGAEGTDAMLARVAELHRNGRIPAGRPAVLAKFAKPGQELRADMPTIGPDTITGAQAAGIEAIYLSAGNTLVMDVAQTREAADAAGIAVMGVEPGAQA